jgi:HEAT repeat protein
VLDCEKPGTCREAAMALAAIGPASAPAVDKLLEMADCPVNGAPAIYALGSIGQNTDAVRSKLIAKVRGDDPIAKTVSAWALAKLNPNDKRFVGRAVKLLVETMQSDNADARVAAAKALNSLEVPPEIVRPILLEAFDAANEETVRMMLDASAAVGPKIVPRLIDALQHKELQSHVCYILGEIGPGAAPATAALAELLDDEDVEVGKEAAFALAEIGPAAKEAVDALTKAVKVDGPVRFAAAYALGRIGADAMKAKPALLAQLEGDESMALMSAWALAHIHPECPTCQAKAIPVLIAGLGDSSPQFRREAAAGLCCFGPAAKDAIGPLKKALKDADGDVCEACEAALKAIDK